MIDYSKFVNHFELDEPTQELVGSDWAGDVTADLVGDGAKGVLYHNLITPDVIGALKQQLIQHHWKAVGLDGKGGAYGEIGNYRLSNYNPDMADTIWSRLKTFREGVMVCNPFTPTDHEATSMNPQEWPIYKAVGVSPLFRYIRYKEGGKLVAHYDETFVADAKQRTLMSLVIYLTDNEKGATRFIRDPQAGKRMDEMDFADWDRCGNEDEIIERNPPRAGTGLVFPHRVLHDSEPIGANDPEKIIIRTDLMFERIS